MAGAGRLEALTHAKRNAAAEGGRVHFADWRTTRRPSPKWPASLPGRGPADRPKLAGFSAFEPGARDKQLVALLWAAPFLVIVVLFELLPLAAVAFNSAHVDGRLSLGNFVDIFSSAFQRNAFSTSLKNSPLHRSDRRRAPLCRSPGC